METNFLQPVEHAYNLILIVFSYMYTGILLNKVLCKGDTVVFMICVDGLISQVQALFMRNYGV